MFWVGPFSVCVYVCVCVCVRVCLCVYVCVYVCVLVGLWEATLCTTAKCPICITRKQQLSTRKLHGCVVLSLYGCYKVDWEFVAMQGMHTFLAT